MATGYSWNFQSVLSIADAVDCTCHRTKLVWNLEMEGLGAGITFINSIVDGDLGYCILVAAGSNSVK